jgi:hypothetical protein
VQFATLMEGSTGVITQMVSDLGNRMLLGKRANSDNGWASTFIDIDFGMQLDGNPSAFLDLQNTTVWSSHLGFEGVRETAAAKAPYLAARVPLLIDVNPDPQIVDIFKAAYGKQSHDGRVPNSVPVVVSVLLVGVFGAPLQCVQSRSGGAETVWIGTCVTAALYCIVSSAQEAAAISGMMCVVSCMMHVPRSSAAKRYHPLSALHHLQGSLSFCQADHGVCSDRLRRVLSSPPQEAVEVQGQAPRTGAPRPNSRRHHTYSHTCHASPQSAYHQLHPFSPAAGQSAGGCPGRCALQERLPGRNTRFDVQHYGIERKAFVLEQHGGGGSTPGDRVSPRYAGGTRQWYL